MGSPFSAKSALNTDGLVYIGRTNYLFTLKKHPLIILIYTNNDPKPPNNESNKTLSPIIPRLILSVN